MCVVLEGVIFMFDWRILGIDIYIKKFLLPPQSTEYYLYEIPLFIIMGAFGEREREHVLLWKPKPNSFTF